MIGRPRRIQEPVIVPSRVNGLFPKAFVWRGRRHEVQAVEACRSEARRGWRGTVERHFFRVRAPGGVYELSQEIEGDTWSLEHIWPTPAQ